MADLAYADDIARRRNLPYAMLKFSTVESMEGYLNYRECHREFEDVKEVPPMGLIVIQSFMERAWTWKRLVPWTVGLVPLKDYMDYLNKYLEKNASVRPEVCDAAERCLKVEKKYVDSRRGPLSEKDAALSSKIMKAENMRDSASSSLTAAAGLMCIAEEARLMSKFASGTRMFKFGNEVRQCASEVMLYDGPESQSVAAALMGMAKEARIARKLRYTIAEPESFERMEVCKVVRDCSLSLLILLRRTFVLEAPATSTKDKTEGCDIPEKSSDDNFVGNKNSMDINQNKKKKRKRLSEIEDSEGMAVSSPPRP